MRRFYRVACNADAV